MDDFDLTVVPAKKTSGSSASTASLLLDTNKNVLVCVDRLIMKESRQQNIKTSSRVTLLYGSPKITKGYRRRLVLRITQPSRAAMSNARTRYTKRA